MAKTPLIYDGDMGGDDLWAITMLLAHHDKFDILGFATCFGNVSQPLATENLLNHLHWLGQTHKFEVAQGADFPCDGMRPFGDDAYGESGVGGVIFEKSPQTAIQGDIADWYAAKLDSSSETVTIFCTGPATNLALLLKKHPEKACKVKEIVFMSGAIDPPGEDGKPSFNDEYGKPTGIQRIGNITHFAEFNAFQDPKALNIIMDCGVKALFVSADATQHVIYTPARQARLQALDEAYGPAFHRMMIVVESKDRTKFGVDGSFAHDSTAAVYLIQPDLFKSIELDTLHFDESAPLPMDTTRRGAATLTGMGHATWVNGVKDEEAAYKIIEDGIKTMVAQALKNPKRLAG